MDCGHLFILTRPAETASLIEAFLGREAGAEAA